MMSHLKFSSSSVVVLVLISGLLLCSQCFNIIEPDDQILKVPQETSKPPRFPPDTLQSYTPNPKQGFVTTKNGHFYLNDQLFDFRSLKSVFQSIRPCSLMIGDDLTYEMTLNL